jgi:hypothetical protein
MSAFLYTLVGIVVGGLIAYYFSRQASKELRAEAETMRRETEDARHYVNTLISYLEAAGQIEVVRDEDGRPIQTKIIRLSGTMGGEMGVFGTLTVGQGSAARVTPEPRRWLLTASVGRVVKEEL